MCARFSEVFVQHNDNVSLVLVSALCVANQQHRLQQQEQPITRHFLITFLRGVCESWWGQVNSAVHDVL